MNSDGPLCVMETRSGMRVTESDFKRRTQDLALAIINLVSALPGTSIARILGNQLARCGTSVGANYRAACRARSTAEMIAKLGIVLEEADEALYWVSCSLDPNTWGRKRLLP